MTRTANRGLSYDRKSFHRKIMQLGKISSQKLFANLLDREIRSKLYIRFHHDFARKQTDFEFYGLARVER